MPKILPISDTVRVRVAMVCSSAWRTPCSWSALLWCSALVKPAKRYGRTKVDQVLSVTLVTLSTEYLRAYAGPSSVLVAPLFLKFYRNID